MKLIHFSLFIFLTLSVLDCQNSPHSGPDAPAIFYVDARGGDDGNPGSLDRPFQTLDKALEIVTKRVQQGIRSDKIYLREGRYKKVSDTTWHRLELKGTPDDYAELSAMPCEPDTPGCVQRKSGRWYENVVFDAAWVVDTPWEKVPGKEYIWKTNPGYTNLEWTHQNLWPWTRSEKGFPITDKDETPETTLFTVAPYMLLQDGEPTVWADYVETITEPGMRTYDHETGELYVWPYENEDPNTSTWESWYGGPEDYGIGTLHLDGEGRALFNGDMEFAAIRGFEFYMFNKIFEFRRRKIEKESLRDIQRYVLIEDNLYRYGWMHILLDANTVNASQKDVLLPRYQDRSHWTARNNVFYRPSRECFQLHGDNHIFEYNDIIERNGPWAGPAAVVSCVNTRNTRNAKIRHNYFYRHGNSEWARGSVFMIEVGHGSQLEHQSSTHASETGDYIYGGQTFENNVFDQVVGPVMVLGKGGGIRMQEITVRNNIFKDGTRGEAIRISTPHRNLIVENNIFYNQERAISMPGPEYAKSYQNSPSSISIRNNIFANSRRAIDPALLEPHENSNVYIGQNLFYRNEEEQIGAHSITRNPGFRSPEELDFRPVSAGNRGIQDYHYFGPYPPDGSYAPATDWWNRKLYSEEKRSELSQAR